MEIERPQFASLPPILGEAGTKKLGKRDGAKDILDYSKEGYLPSAMMNFLAFIGWNPGEGNNKEVMLKDELIESFDIKHIQKAGGKFNEEKLDWLNKEHLKLLSKEEIEKNILEWLPEGKKDTKLVPIIIERISKWGDIKTMDEAGEFDLFFNPPAISKEKLLYKNTTEEKTKENLQKVIEALQNIDEKDFTLENIKNFLTLISEMASSRGEILHPVRYALSGKDKSPDPFIIAFIIGKDETISRLHKAI